MTERLVQIAHTAAQAGHGRKEAIYTAACAELGLARSTLLRGLKDVAVAAQRQRRSDAGEVLLPRDEAQVIATVLMESHRKNAKRLLSINQAVVMLRANGLVKAEATDADGVIRPLSDSAISRALRRYSLHPGQLLRPAPAKELISLHPNHVWEIDASLCVLYYLRNTDGRNSGLQVMAQKVFNKNKPANLARIESDRVWSYEVTDHYSGSIFVHYVLGAESGFNLAESFIESIQPRNSDGIEQPFHGVPLIMLLDMGSAMTGGLFKNLARRLGMQVIPHSAGNARATGQVEQARDIIERSFESALKFKPVASLAELNAAARQWAAWINAHKEHSRHGQTRYAMWQTITAEQLRLAPPPDLCRDLLTHAPEGRQVTAQLTVPFKGYGDFDVSEVPNIQVGETLQVTYNPFDLADGALRSAMVVTFDAEGNEVLQRVAHVPRNAAGFRTDGKGNVIGEDWARNKDTLADTNRKLLERMAMGADTDTQAAASRKAKALPFGGQIDPYKHITDTPGTTWLPKRGTPLQPTTRVAAAAEQVLTLFEAAAQLVRRGVAMTPERNAQVAAWHPTGVPESALDELVHRLAVRATLRVVGGGSLAND